MRIREARPNEWTPIGTEAQMMAREIKFGKPASERAGNKWQELSKHTVGQSRWWLRQ